MVLPSILTYRVGPELQLDTLSDFLMIVREKIEVLVSEYIYAKLICKMSHGPIM
jgi:hypothetical protein